jgi:hypothetical protein
VVSSGRSDKGMALQIEHSPTPVRGWVSNELCRPAMCSRFLVHSAPRAARLEAFFEVPGYRAVGRSSWVPVPSFVLGRLKARNYWAATIWSYERAGSGRQIVAAADVTWPD